MQGLAGVSRHNLLCTRRGAHSHASPTLLSLPRRRLSNVTAAAVALTLGIYYLAWPSSSRHAPTSASLPLALSRFTPVTIESSEDTGPSTKIISLKVPPNLLPSPNDHLLRPIHSIYVKDGDMQIERPYTPLFGIESDGRIRLWVKRYEYGEVGRWLHAKKPGDVIEIRGPALTWDFERELKEGKWDDIIMVRVPCCLLVSGALGWALMYIFIMYSPYCLNFLNSRYQEELG
jgi:cytochrome-b5 reductase